jgi:hypothetical protein
MVPEEFQRNWSGTLERWNRRNCEKVVFVPPLEFRWNSLWNSLWNHLWNAYCEPA